MQIWNMRQSNEQNETITGYTDKEENHKYATIIKYNLRKQAVLIMSSEALLSTEGIVLAVVKALLCGFCSSYGVLYWVFAVSLLIEPFLWVLLFVLEEESQNQAGGRASMIYPRVVLLHFTLLLLQEQKRSVLCNCCRSSYLPGQWSGGSRRRGSCLFVWVFGWVFLPCYVQSAAV